MASSFWLAEKVFFGGLEPQRLPPPQPLSQRGRGYIARVLRTLNPPKDFVL